MRIILRTRPPSASEQEERSTVWLILTEPDNQFWMTGSLPMSVHHAGEVAFLTGSEAAMCRPLFARFEVVLAYEDLADALYLERTDGGADSTKTLLKVMIYRLRKKLMPIGFMVKTAWGQGVALVECDPGVYSPFLGRGPLPAELRF